MSKSREYGDDELVMNYHDACIYGRDLKLLESDSSSWLNDACIHYYLTRLQQQYPNKQLFMDPSVVSFLMHQCEEDEELLDLWRGYDFACFHRIFVPINDNMASSHWTTPGLGTHWSLLVVMMEESVPSYYHFDSVPGGNAYAAQAVAAKWQQLWQVATTTGQNDLGQAKVCECRAPRQTNGYDCAVHLLATAQALSSSSSDDLEAVVDEQVGNGLREDPNFCANLRQFVADDIRQLAGLNVDEMARD